MKKTQSYGIWIYGLLCLVLTMLYRYRTEAFTTKIMGLNLAFWYPLLINLILIGIATYSLKRKDKLFSALFLFAPISVYSFYNSWVNINYEHLVIFLSLPIFLLSMLTFRKYIKK